MGMDPDKQEENKPLRDELGRLLPGNTANPNGRPKGKTLKEYQGEKFRTMTDEEKEQWIRDNNISGIDVWRMSEGNPHNTSDEKVELTIPKPIHEGIYQHVSNETDIQPEEKG